MAVVLEMQEISKSYGNLAALQGFNLKVESGEAVALLGPNGAGKTTAIHLILGLRRPTRGSVRLMGGAPTDPRTRSHLGAMLQDSGIPLSLRVHELLELFRSYYRAPLPTRELLQRSGLEAKARSLAGDLSGGERQRLYFALAIAGDPEVLFLDEPTVGMDTKSRRAFWDELKKLQQEGRTLLFTTHYLEEADRLAQRIIILNRGRIIAEGSPQTIKEQVGQSQVRLSCPTPHRAAQLLQEFGVAVRLEGTQLSFASARPEPILAKLFQAGLDLEHLEVRPASLEEAFLDLTEEVA
jgi:ABC-2 type transport system ATP-binding protein